MGDESLQLAGGARQGVVAERAVDWMEEENDSSEALCSSSHSTSTL